MKWSPASEAEPGRLVARWKEGKPNLHRIENLEDPVFLRLVNARTDDDLLVFLHAFGAPNGKASVELTELRALANTLLSTAEASLYTATGHAAAFDRMHKLMAGVSVSPLIVQFEHEPRMVLEAATLEDFMKLEIGAAFEAGVKVMLCQHCHRMRLTGPLTGGRAHAKFCSNKCRVAAMRARQAAPGAKK
jgi:hypothetical protein